MAPGAWIHARDMFLSDKGSMRVLLDDTVSLADARGPELDQGSAPRILAEMPWYPTALFDARTVTWAAIDADHARAGGPMSMPPRSPTVDPPTALKATLVTAKVLPSRR